MKSDYEPDLTAVRATFTLLNETLDNYKIPLIESAMAAFILLDYLKARVTAEHGCVLHLDLTPKEDNEKDKENYE